MRIERCACGGIIAADRAYYAPVVAAHNRTARHLRWRGVRYHRCAGVGGSPCAVDVPVDRHLCHYCRRTLALAGLPDAPR